VQPWLQWKSNKYYIFRVFVDLDIQHAMRMRPTVICRLPGSAIFFHIVINGKIFEREKVIEHKMCLFSL